MIEIKEFSKVKSDNTESVTFKISVSDKQKLLNDATELDMSLSEFLRIKVLIEDADLKKLISQNRELTNQVKERLVRTKIPLLGQADEHSIVIQSTETGKKVMREFLTELKYRNRIMPQSDYDDDKDIAVALSIIITEELSRYLEEFRGIRKRYKITQLEQFYRLLFKHYYDSVFTK